MNLIIPDPDKPEPERVRIPLGVLGDFARGYPEWFTQRRKARQGGRENVGSTFEAALPRRAVEQGEHAAGLAGGGLEGPQASPAFFSPFALLFSPPWASPPCRDRRALQPLTCTKRR